MTTPKKWTYYIVVEATEKKGWLKGDATWAGVLELGYPLTSEKAIDTVLKWIMKNEDLQNAVIVWWTLLSTSEENNDSET